MARTKKTTKRYYKKTRWSPNIQEIPTTNLSIVAGPDVWHFDYTLCTNPEQNNNLVSQTYTVKNMEVQFELDWGQAISQSTIEDIAYYIMFVPQGMNITANYNIEHPEYIMAYKYYGSPANDTNDRYIPKIKTRLSRKLQTGDSIILFLKGSNVSSTAANPSLHGLVRWWTKAN